MRAGVRAGPVMDMERDVLLVIDVQNSFVSGGSLAVPRGEEIVPLINSLAIRFKHVVLTQDWHPPGHISFASSHPGTKPFEGFDALVIEDACRAIDTQGSLAAAWKDMLAAGVEGVRSEGLGSVLSMCRGLAPCLNCFLLGARNGQSTLCAV